MRLSLNWLRRETLQSNYKAVIISPEQAFRITMELGEPYRTLMFLVAVTGLRISEALGLKWSDLDYERQRVQLYRVWVGNELVPRMLFSGRASRRCSRFS